MPAENEPSSADDLFEEEPRDESPVRSTCSACGNHFDVDKGIRFCSACGEPLPEAGDAGPVSVLLAEDAIVSRRKITAVLERLGCVVAAAANGREAVELAHQLQPHLIILDVHMPDLNGLEALDILRGNAKFQSTVIVMLTGEADASVVREALTHGANDYIRKGSSPTELGQRLNRHVQTIRSKV